MKNDHRVLISVPKKLHESWSKKYRGKVNFSSFVRAAMAKAIINDKDIDLVEELEFLNEWLEENR